jgi:hypothetical protein
MEISGKVYLAEREKKEKRGNCIMEKAGGEFVKTTNPANNAHFKLFAPHCPIIPMPSAEINYAM